MKVNVGEVDLLNLSQFEGYLHGFLWVQRIKEGWERPQAGYIQVAGTDASFTMGFVALAVGLLPKVHTYICMFRVNVPDKIHMIRHL